MSGPSRPADREWWDSLSADEQFEAWRIEADNARGLWVTSKEYQDAADKEESRLREQDYLDSAAEVLADVRRQR